MLPVPDSSSFAPVLTLPCRTCLHSASCVLAVQISCCVMAVFVFRKHLFINKLYRIYVCYTNIMLYIAFIVICGFTWPLYVLECNTCEYRGTPVFTTQLKPSGMWHCCRWMVPDVTKGHCFIFIRHEAVFMLKAPCFYVTYKTTGPVTQCHFPED
jgi:hypothetical protein